MPYDQLLVSSWDKFLPLDGAKAWLTEFKTWGSDKNVCHLSLKHMWPKVVNWLLEQCVYTLLCVDIFFYVDVVPSFFFFFFVPPPLKHPASAPAHKSNHVNILPKHQQSPLQYCHNINIKVSGLKMLWCLNLSCSPSTGGAFRGISKYWDTYRVLWYNLKISWYNFQASLRLSLKHCVDVDVFRASEKVMWLVWYNDLIYREI